MTNSDCKTFGRSKRTVKHLDDLHGLFCKEQDPARKGDCNDR